MLHRSELLVIIAENKIEENTGNIKKFPLHFYRGIQGKIGMFMSNEKLPPIIAISIHLMALWMP